MPERLDLIASHPASHLGEGERRGEVTTVTLIQPRLIEVITNRLLDMEETQRGSVEVIERVFAEVQAFALRELNRVFDEGYSVNFDQAAEVLRVSRVEINQIFLRFQHETEEDYLISQLENGSEESESLSEVEADPVIDGGFSTEEVPFDENLTENIRFDLNQISLPRRREPLRRAPGVTPLIRRRIVNADQTRVAIQRLQIFTRRD